MCDEQQPVKRIIDFFDPRGNTSYVETDTVGIINVTAQKRRIREFLERVHLQPELTFATVDLLPVEEIAAILRTGRTASVLLEMADAGQGILVRNWPEDWVRTPLEPDFDVREFIDTGVTISTEANAAVVAAMNSAIDGPATLCDLERRLTDDDLVEAYMGYLVAFRVRVLMFRRARGESGDDR
ncbi:hypothetical protein [Gordonia paraffinivorans]|uniref:hypothetical protein n=1 Tax=Gordonia paraffinivorans TaxID=175628 RepID=UPI001445CEAE|nr:hypothetical protein [Gordonia paraffinivorans]